jgi:hypothetical protein
MADAEPTRVGDLIVIHGHRVGDRHRLGEILEILGSGAHEHYRVRWDDDGESIFTPGSDAVIRHGRTGTDEPVLMYET